AAHAGEIQACLGGWAWCSQRPMSIARLLLVALGLILSAAAPAFAEEVAPAQTPAPAPAAAAKKLPFNSIADEVGVTGFTHKNKKGPAQKFILTPQTVIENDGVAATWAQVKAGDEIHGSRIRHGTD